MDFEGKLQEKLDKLPYEKHVDDGQYNDGQLDGFEAGARWAFALYIVSQQRELLVAVFEKMTRPQITMLEIGDYEELADELLSN